jgi:hypothetical protein
MRVVARLPLQKHALQLRQSKHLAVSHCGSIDCRGKLRNHMILNNVHRRGGFNQTVTNQSDIGRGSRIEILRSPLFARGPQPRAKSASDHQSQHPEVADERPERMTEGGGGVLFQKKVTGPGKAVAQRNPEQREPGMMGRESDDGDDEPERRPDSVHPTIARIAVLLQIKGEELVVRTECVRLGHRKLRCRRLVPPAEAGSFAERRCSAALKRRSTGTHARRC